MIKDHYATLGVAPTTENAFIRAAYLALVRCYHPDINQSAEAGERTRAINAAYAVLSDPQRRAEYDCVRAYFKPQVVVPDGRKWPSSQTGGMLLSGAGALSLVLAVMWLPDMNFESSAFQRSDPASPFQIAQPADALAKVYPAAQTGPAVEPANDSLSSLEVTPLQSVVVPQKQNSIDAVQRLSSSEPIVSTPKPIPISDSRNIAPPARRSTDPPVVPVARLQDLAGCASARSKVAAAICEDSNVGALDRQLSTFFGQSVRHSNELRRAQLFRGQERFLNRLNSCSSDDCLTKAYLQRMGEIANVMTAPLTPVAAPIQ